MSVNKKMNKKCVGAATAAVKIQRVTFGAEGISVNVVSDNVITEQAFILRVNNNVLEYSLLCTPCAIDDLVYGFLFSENIVGCAEDIDIISRVPQENFINVFVKERVVQKNIRNQEGENAAAYWQKLYTQMVASENDLSVQGSLDKFYVKKIFNIINRLREKQTVFNQTGASHAALLFNRDGEELYFAEDVSRHNALDRVIGQCLRQRNIMLSDCALALSSRVNVELIAKAARAGIKLVAAISAPTSLAIAAANYWQITLCGFVRNDRMNIYTCYT